MPHVDDANIRTVYSVNTRIELCNVLTFQRTTQVPMEYSYLRIYRDYRYKSSSIQLNENQPLMHQPRSTRVHTLLRSAATAATGAEEVEEEGEKAGAPLAPWPWDAFCAGANRC